MNHVVDDVTIRPLAPGDDIESLTALLHQAYARLGASGFNYTAVDQSAQVTRDRVASGSCFVAEVDKRVVGTITLSRPRAGALAAYTLWPAINQLAVEPALQTRGVGNRLMAHAESAARAVFTDVIVDTAQGATPLIDWYTRRGYRLIAITQWSGKRYRSVVMKKSLGDSTPAVS